MSRTIQNFAGLYLLPRCRRSNNDGTVSVEDVRAVATEGALATAADASPAALVSLWAHDERLHRDARTRRGR